ncbi:putative chaperonin-like RbcX [Rosa chinensis]|uniref:Putative chaperonin-like RbcX n=1 Tax=Rosa chinensis TaxID=74649 RepID=A0A2P6Q2G9_ROSCH|nr:putative chaperonin-like RbcX [Rosa chinensis]
MGVLKLLFYGIHMAALRILEVRSAYCKNDFEWDNLKRLACKMVDESNTRLMRDYVLETSHVDNEGK